MRNRARTDSPLEWAAELLCCPHDGERMQPTAGGLQCSACHSLLVSDSGVLLEQGQAPLVPETGALRLMESPFIAGVYERFWRPTLLRMVSSLTYDTEDEIVDRHAPSRSGLRILELCCGTARAGRRWIPRGAVVVGVDQSRAMLRQARRLASQESLILVQADATRPIAKAKGFDVVMCFASMHLLWRPQLLIERAATALRSGGVFFSWALTDAGLLASPLLRKLVIDRVGLRVLPPRALASHLITSGLEVVDQHRMEAAEFVVARHR